jgi:hypothetical protein
MAMTQEVARRAQLKAVAEAYFAGMGQKDMSHVPWADDVVLRSPLAPGGLDQTPPRPPFHQCIIKAVGFFAVEKPITPSKTTMSFSGRPRKSSRLNDA